MTSSSAWALLSVGTASLLTLACGGVSEEADGTDDASGGAESSSGGGSGSTNAGGESAGGGSSTGGGGGQVECCLGLPGCAPGDTIVDSEADCPEHASCYESSHCCVTIWCARQEVQCAAIPVCSGDSVEVEVCPEGAHCTEQTMCGHTILCLDEENPPSCGGGPTCPDGTKEVGACPSSGECQSETYCGATIYCLAEGSDPECEPDDPNRQYVGENLQQCAVVDLSCGDGLEAFEDECGCGCEQEATCPRYIDCMPGSDVHTGCSDSAECPLSERVY